MILARPVHHSGPRPYFTPPCLAKNEIGREPYFIPPVAAKMKLAMDRTSFRPRFVRCSCGFGQSRTSFRPIQDLGERSLMRYFWPSAVHHSGPNTVAEGAHTPVRLLHNFKALGLFGPRPYFIPRCAVCWQRLRKGRFGHRPYFIPGGWAKTGVSALAKNPYIVLAKPGLPRGGIRSWVF